MLRNLGLAERPRPELIPLMTAEEKGAGSFVRLDFGLGLYVIGTEMNKSGRIDRQLRGRSGRQGDFGASRFIVSLEDQLLAFRGDNASCMSDSAQRDSAGRRFFEGPRLERHLDEIQREVECDDSVVRGLMHEYDRILQEQTLAYYSARSEVIGMSSLHEIFESFAREYAARFVDKHFPELRLWDYQSQFDGMAEELWLEFEIDCRDFEGLGLDLLPEAIGDLLIIRLESLREGLGPQVYVTSWFIRFRGIMARGIAMCPRSSSIAVPHAVFSMLPAWKSGHPYPAEALIWRTSHSIRSFPQNFSPS